ncbi:MAG: NAD(P)H-hydrate epimerase [Planctomycetes bacterium]|nr:NAD(P)H-hydrate epimerase [Planctomycetota bacterium]
MTSPVLSCADVRALEQRAIHELGLPSLVLMENAGRNLAELLVSFGVKSRVVVCCGKGNNGGDGMVLARHLDNRRIDVHVLLFGRPEELTPDAALNWQVLLRSGVSVEMHPGQSPDLGRMRDDLATAEWVVDALFGTGLRGPLRAPFDAVVRLINESSARVLAVDIPSGLDGDTGRPLGATVRAGHTGTFLALKAGFVQPQSREWTGEVHLLDIGLPRRYLPA